jgi:hypothetical protein
MRLMGQGEYFWAQLPRDILVLRVGSQVKSPLWGAYAEAPVACRLMPPDFDIGFRLRKVRGVL